MSYPAPSFRNRNDLLRFLRNSTHKKAQQNTLEGLLWAIQLQRAEYVSSILASGKVDPNVVVDGDPLIVRVVQNACLNLEVLEALLRGGCDPKPALDMHCDPEVLALLKSYIKST
jgi:hypothetical protein